MTESEYDFIVVGGGTAGCCVAGRLAENANVSVLVIEAGIATPLDEDKIRIPGAAFNLVETEYDWAYESTLVDRDDCRRNEKNTRGKVLGGSSCLNYLAWMRGSRGTYDEWAEFGGQHWNFDACLPYFSKCANFHDEQIEMAVDPAVLGTRGPLQISPSISIPLAGPLRQAWESRGYPWTEDIFSGEVDGMTHVVVAKYRGVRTCSAAYVEGKSNVTIKAGRRSRKILVRDGVAIGVEVEGPHGKETYMAKHEVILSQGVYESPKLLLLSGIGPRPELQKYGIECIVDSFHVGHNLIDHPVFPYVVAVEEGTSVDQYIRPGPAHDEALSQHKDSRTGPLCSGLLEIAAFPHVEDRLKVCPEWREEFRRRTFDPLSPTGQPHFELDFIPAFASPFLPHVERPTEGDYLTVVVDLLRPLSRGKVSLNSSDPLDPPMINENFCANPLDIVGLREGIRFVDELLRRGHGMKQIVRDAYPDALPLASDELMHDVILERVTTGYHPCGTCRMGKNIEEGVVDGNLRVYGVKNLRVIDASIDPVIPDCRPQQVVYMTAEKGSDLIKQDYPDLYSEHMFTTTSNIKTDQLEAADKGADHADSEQPNEIEHAGTRQPATAEEEGAMESLVSKIRGSLPSVQKQAAK